MSGLASWMVTDALAMSRQSHPRENVYEGFNHKVVRIEIGLSDLLVGQPRRGEVLLSSLHR
jgi:hypothetical protein